jgi:hypothetical protein
LEIPDTAIFDLRQVISAGPPTASILLRAFLLLVDDYLNPV